ncbi:hypothetical protein E3P81_03473 [Wallemia ichthyophaga]|nr:hypothetical protein E3P97_03510 [Wallemia ichthyophaga]TIB29258.1 hypothetical protein E3P85_03248 [Wallemia ichthyophaga]TIB44512.1 hypothetical protein E3P82_03478 [Wallemia ichthyophaga]TIB46955.1 hypothetical protein E3P81_03473 [Wallemia ichthyophaga]TIB49838.1 hypothetical protein E3P80_03482 [Wallemia ichthyophaga]
MSAEVSKLITRAGEASVNCGSKYHDNSLQGLRIGAIFIVMATSALGTLLPIVTGRVKGLGLPKIFYDTIKYFGSGVIVATAFIHLLAEAFGKLTDQECLSGAWNDYNWAPALAEAAVFFIFFAELWASRLGNKYLERRGMNYDNHGHDNVGGIAGSHGAETYTHTSDSHPQVHDAPATTMADQKSTETNDMESVHSMGSFGYNTMSMITGVAILEFGVLFHSAILGLTLATSSSDEFRVLLIVIVFHQMFEGLGLGARLAELPVRQTWIPYTGATCYFLITPIFVAIGLGVRETYNSGSTAALITTGLLNSISAGILLYTGLVELLAHDFIFSSHMKKASDMYVLYAGFCVLLGAGLMSLLGNWA